MEHPILANRYGILIYLGFWFIFTSILFIIDWYFQNAICQEAIISAFSISLPLLIIAPSIWYVVRHIDVEKIGRLAAVLHHIAVAIIIVSAWLSLTYFIYAWFGDSMSGDNKPDIIIPHYWLIFMAFAIYDYIVMMYYMIVYYRNFKEKIEHESELKDLVKEAELNALKSQINPHFLFNSLNSVSALTLIRPEQSRDMLVKLSTFLRYSLNQDLKELNTLSNEMENSRLYLEIEKIRFGDRLVLDFEFDTISEALQIPNLILQPIYENAIKHGVHESIEPVVIKTLAEIRNGNLIIQISNNFDRDAIAPKGEGIGLKNIQKRLSLIYGRNDLLRITRTGSNFTVNLEFPQ